MLNNAISLFALFCLSFNSLFGQEAVVTWARTAGGTNSDTGQEVTTDANNNVYSAGWFESNITSLSVV